MATHMIGQDCLHWYQPVQAELMLNVSKWDTEVTSLRAFAWVESNVHAVTEA